MNMGVASLIALVVAIVIGYFKKANVGILAISMAFLIGIIYGIKGKDIIAGFSSSLALSMIGVTYLFGIINSNGTLQKFAGKLVSLAGTRKWLIYVMVYITGAVLCAVGPGAIPTLAIIPILAVPIALSSGLNPILLSLVGQMGIQSFRMSPITPEAVVVQGLMDEQGIAGSTVTIIVCMVITELLMIAGSFIIFKGWKIEEVTERELKTESEPFNRVNWISIAGLLVMIVLVAFKNWNVGLTSFLVGSVLLVLGCADEKQAIKSIPWNTILLVIGVGILMNIVSISGGLDIMANSLSSIMGPRTASAIMVAFAGFMSFFSSGLGVVFPTLVPISGAVASSVGANALELVATVVIGGTVTGFSPISTAGALIMAAVGQDETAAERYPQDKLFLQLFGVAFMAMAISVVLAIAGVYGIICR